MKIKLDGIEYTVTEKVITMDGATLLLERTSMRDSLVAEGLRVAIDDCFDKIERHGNIIKETRHELEILEKKLEEIES